MKAGAKKAGSGREMSPLRALDDILGSDLSSILQALPDAAARVEKKLQKNAALFQKKTATLSEPDRHATLMEKIDRIEASFAKTYTVDLQERAGVEYLAGHLFSLYAKGRRGIFLKESSARALLQKHPPKYFVDAALKDPLDSRSIIALTRHTEPDDWQHTYQALTRTLTPADFEDRELTFQVVDQDLHGRVLRTHRWKPWLVSHNKETGIINCFTASDSKFRAPLLQFISVFMHYAEETASAGEFFKQTAGGTPPLFGERVLASITNTSDMFGYFQPHVYSETLFWRHACRRLITLFPAMEADFFAETLDCGDGTISLNVVDLLWDRNLSHSVDAAEYFGETRSYFTYHFREALWYEMFRELLGMDHESFEKAVVAKLDRGDRALTKELIAEVYGDRI